MSVRCRTYVSLIYVWYLHIFTRFWFLVIENYLVSVWWLINKIEVHIVILWRDCVIDSALVVYIVKVLKRLLYYALVACLVSFSDVPVGVNIASYYWRLSSCVNYSHWSMTCSFFHYFLIFKYCHFFFLVFLSYIVFYVWSLRKLLLIKLNILLKLVLIPVIIIAGINLYDCLTYVLLVLAWKISFAACNSYIFFSSLIQFKVVLVLLKICLINLLLLLDNQIGINNLLCFMRSIIKTIWYELSFYLSVFLKSGVLLNIDILFNLSTLSPSSIFLVHLINFKSLNLLVFHLHIWLMAIDDMILIVENLIIFNFETFSFLMLSHIFNKLILIILLN